MSRWTTRVNLDRPATHPHVTPATAATTIRKRLSMTLLVTVTAGALDTLDRTWPHQELDALTVLVSRIGALGDLGQVAASEDVSGERDQATDPPRVGGTARPLNADNGDQEC